ncbi:hypothetical protein H0H92_009040 [Tricholoma furcatifolium]|nr:hypothetical protein H0H92_009040 [Tricholoma furcatifolium]
MEMAFVDPKLEGAFAASGYGTADGRAKIDDYIQEQIRTHNSIIRYYKNRQNALTLTCRIPLEILACVFSQVVNDATADIASSASIKWIRSISHICSHWREVALSTPTLWSTINVEHPTWASEMLQRSKDVPLAVINEGNVLKKAYPVLLQTLTSHLSRIHNLVMGRSRQISPFFSYSGHNGGTVNMVEFQALLQLLAQYDCPRLKYLEMNSVGMPVVLSQLQLPDRIITRSASLTHLTLQGYGINWELSPAFEGLRSFNIFLIPPGFQPSNAQLLRFLSRVPFLETLSVTAIDHLQEVLSSQNVERIHMKYLKHLTLECESLPIIDSLFDYLTFPKNSIITISLQFVVSDPPLDPLFTAVLQKLTRRLDDATDGPVLDLSRGTSLIQCWKTTQRRSEGRPMIELKPVFTSFGAPTPRLVNGVVIRSLRLEQLAYLVVDYIDAGIWSFISDLPQLEELKVYRNEKAVIKALSYDLPSESRTRIQVVRTPFSALTRLTIDHWELGRFWDKSSHKETIAEKLLGCFKLRHEARLFLKRLRFEDCIAIEDPHWSQFERFIDEVEWDANELREDYETYSRIA